MIVTRLMGGLGNQMFEYASGLGLAERRGTNLKIDTNWYATDGKKAEANWVYELHNLALDTPIIDPAELPDLNPSRWQQRLSRVLPQNGLKILNEGDLTFHQKAYDAPDNTFLIGYWQCERYFTNAEATLRRDFAFRHPATGKNATMLKEIQGEMAISVHVRRGDYVTGPTASKVHGGTSLEYYADAIKAISAKIKDPRFYVFSDEPEWCKENLKFGSHPVTYVEGNSIDKGYEDMRLMSACKHHIVANSSFSWWGAWLNPDPNKLVYAPKVWFIDPNKKTDIVPDSWIKL